MNRTIQREGTLTLPSDREILMQRVFQAPPATLFEMWTKPEHVRHWYAVRSTTMTVCEIDLRVGGAWRWVVVAPNGMEIAFSGVFQEINPPHSFRRTEVYEAMPGAGAIVTVSFDEEDDGYTTMNMHMLFPAKSDRDICLQSGMELGVRECYQKMDELLARA